MQCTYHPSSKGLVERFVQTFKRNMKASEHLELSFHQQLMSCLLSYRATSHTTTQVAPASLFLQRHVRTRLDLVRPEIEDIVSASQATQKQHHDRHSWKRDFFIGQRVMVRNLPPWPQWIIVERKGPLTYLVQVSQDRSWKRHVDHLRQTTDTPQEQTPFLPAPEAAESPEAAETATVPLGPGQTSTELITSIYPGPYTEAPSSQDHEAPQETPPTP